MRTTKQVILRILLALFGIFFGTVIFELFLRCIDPGGVSYFVFEKAFYRMAVGAADPILAWEYPTLMENRLGHTYSTNSLGFRGPEMDVPKPAGVQRILFLGDSLVFGMSVDDGEEFPALLQAEFIRNGRGDIQVINGGVNGYNVIQYLAAYEDKYSFMEPDVIAILIISNDSELLVSRHRTFSFEDWLKHRPKAFLQPSRFQNAIVKKRFLEFPYIRALFSFYRWTRKEPPQKASDGHLYLDPHSEGWRQNLTALDIITKRSHARGFKLVIASERYSPQLEEFCRQRETEYFPLYFGEEKMKDPSLRASRVDPHPSEKGHKRIAIQFAEWLKCHHWLGLQTSSSAKRS